jgi:hypothetical protein
VLAEQFVLRLDCRISLTSHYSNGTKIQEQLSSIFTIRQSETHIRIHPDSEKFEMFNSKTGKNLSDKEKWYLVNEYPTHGHQIVINRYTGEILYDYKNFVSNGELLKHVEAAGFCRKLEDIDKKLF